MIVDVPIEVQMAIRLRAVKAGISTGEVVAIAIRERFPHDLQEAYNTMKEQRDNNANR